MATIYCGGCLSGYHHTAHLLKSACCQAVDVDSAGHLVAADIAPVPQDPMASNLLPSIYQCPDALPHPIIDGQFDVPGVREVVGDESLRVERVRDILAQVMGSRSLMVGGYIRRDTRCQSRAINLAIFRARIEIPHSVPAERECSYIAPLVLWGPALYPKRFEFLLNR